MKDKYFRFHRREARVLKKEDIRRIIFDEIDRNKDFVVCVSGEEGEGKSLTAIAIARAIWKKQFSMKDSIVYTGNSDEFDKKYDKLQQNGVLIMDEAMYHLYKMDFMLQKTKLLVKRYAAEARKEKHACHILCIPSMPDLHINFRNHRVKIWIELLPRAVMKEDRVGAVVFLKERMPFSEAIGDPWFLHDFNKLWMDEKRHDMLEYHEQKMFLMRSHPHYIGEITIKKPSEKTEDRYLRLRAYFKEKYGKTTPAAEEKDIKRIQRIVYKLRILKNMQVTEIADICGYTKGNISTILKKIREAPQLYPFVASTDDLKPESMEKEDDKVGENTTTG